MAVEIVPATTWTKSSAVRTILAAQVPAACSVLYAGDSDNDADALSAVALAGGISLGVGREAPPARHRLPDPVALSSLLTRLVNQLDHASRPDHRATDKCVALHGMWRSSVFRTFF